jgi:protein phosphatase
MMTLTLTSPFDTGAATHVGKVRQRNEDSFLAQPAIGVWAVADGMGGHQAGDVASATVVAALNTIVHPRSAAELLSQCEDRMVAANAQVRALADERGAVIGTTVAILLVFDRHYACVWSGDSRIYLVRGGQIMQVSRDHTQVQQLVDEGAITAEEALTFPGRNIITRAIGVSDYPELEMESGSLRAGDVFLICSDGLTGHVSDAEILEHVAIGPAQYVCDALIDLTLQRGAHDNVTVVVARYQPRGSTAPHIAGMPRGDWGS